MLLLAGGRVADDGRPDDVLGGAACASAFAVAIQGHRVPGLPHPLYWFEPAR
jgi:hypothetical protein